MKRTAGINIPLFSIRSDRGWGIGEFADVAGIAPFLKEAHLPVLMMLPLVEASLGQDSPYAALSAFALDPVYIALDEMEDFRAIGGFHALSPEELAELQRVRAAKTVDYGAIRKLKEKYLWRSFEHFQNSGAAKEGERARDLAHFRDEHASWLPEYALFRALKEAHKRDWWRGWAPELRDRVPSALAAARQQHANAIQYFEYIQWVAYRQLAAARKAARQHGVLLAGDLPFMVAEDSADVWANQDQFRFDCTIGVPPDAFSADGQDWGLPVYRWDVIKDRKYEWLKLRGKRTADLFDLVRVDHVVGFYRTYARPRDKSEPFFIPADQPSQIQQGEAVLNAIRSGGAEVVAEDLGVVPPFVRKSLTAISVPGYRVLRWEQDDGKFRDPAAWPELSLATTGTHDSEPMSTWWESLPKAERTACMTIPAMKGIPAAECEKFTAAVHQKLLETVYASKSALLVLPVQDVFGARERINLPGTVSSDNWSYRMPWTIEQLATDPFVRSRVAVHAELAKRFNRA